MGGLNMRDEKGEDFKVLCVEIYGWTDRGAALDLLRSDRARWAAGA